MSSCFEISQKIGPLAKAELHANANRMLIKIRLNIEKVLSLFWASRREYLRDSTGAAKISASLNSILFLIFRARHDSFPDLQTQK